MRPIFISGLVLALSWPFSGTIPGAKLDDMRSPDLLLRSLGLLFGSLGLSSYATTLLLATRSRALERFVGGLPQMYRYHHLLGTLAFVLLLAHPLFLALSYYVNSPYAAALFLAVPKWPITASGWAALSVMICFFVATFLMKLPYEVWRWTHIFSGLGFLFGTIHAVYAINRPNAAAMIAGAFVLGFGSYMYWEVWNRLFKKRYDYQVANVERRSPSTVEIELLPSGQRLLFKPGQFAYLSFRESPTAEHRCGIGRESHPFTISSASTDPSLKFLVKASGDYTHKLAQLSPGTKVKVEGPYGAFFGSRPNSHRRLQVWIAGGIGIAPFLGYLRTVKGKPLNVHLHYFLTRREEDLATEELLSIEKQTHGFHAFTHYSDSDGWPSLEQIENSSSLGPDQVVLICGPKGMHQKLRNELRRKGVKRKQIISEDFDFL